MIGSSSRSGKPSSAYQYGCVNGAGHGLFRRTRAVGADEAVSLLRHHLQKVGAALQSPMKIARRAHADRFLTKEFHDAVGCRPQLPAERIGRLRSVVFQTYVMVGVGLHLDERRAFEDGGEAVARFFEQQAHDEERRRHLVSLDSSAYRRDRGDGFVDPLAPVRFGLFAAQRVTALQIEPQNEHAASSCPNSTLERVFS